MNEAEPDEVLLAEYENEGYEGSAHVLYRRGDVFYEVTGSHCSCYGLEGQWRPEAFEAGIWDDYLERIGLRRG